MIQFDNGEWSQQIRSFGETAQIDYLAFGDINADGNKDAAVLVGYTQSQGNAYTQTLYVFLNDHGKPVPADYVHIGDRSLVEHFYIKKGAIFIQAILHGPEDAMCCPSRRTLLKFTLNEGALKKKSTLLGVVVG